MSKVFDGMMEAFKELGALEGYSEDFFNLIDECIEENKEELTEALEDYKITYYLSTATAERRPETIEDVENDWKEETFAADSDYDALLYALELIDNGYDDTDFSAAEEIVKYFEEKDLGDGSAFVVKLEGPNGVIYDMGQTKDDFIEQVKQNDEMLDYYRSVLGIDESLNENSVSSKIPEAIDQFLQDIAQMYQTISYKDIMDHDYTAEDLQKLAKLRGKFRREINYADSGDEEAAALCEEIANKVAEILKSDNLEEAIDASKALEVKKNSDADVIFYGWQYNNEDPVEIDPEELTYEEYQARKDRIVSDYNKLYADKPQANRYAKEHDFIFYALYNRKNEELNEGRFNPYFTPYGYRDAAKVLNRTAPEYYWHLKEIEMDRGDGIKLANYALKKGLPVMLDKHSDPDYPEFYLKDGSSEYHWGDYFYTYGFTNPDATQLVPYEGNLDILNTEKDDNKMNEDMSIRAKLKALYPELNFSDKVEEAINEADNSKVTLEVMFEEYKRYDTGATRKAKVSGKDLLSALKKMVDKMGLYITSGDIEEDNLSAEKVIEKIESTNGDGCDFIFYIKNLSTGELLLNDNYEDEEDWDDEDDYDDDTDFDIDESHETRLMDSLYEGSDDFDEYDDATGEDYAMDNSRDITYHVYSIDDEGYEIDHLESFNNFDEAKAYVDSHEGLFEIVQESYSDWDDMMEAETEVVWSSLSN